MTTTLIPRAADARAADHLRRSDAGELPISSFPAIDGLRAIAILSVLVFHTGVYQNGLFGVDVFFVLSGYLITLSLLREHHRTGGIHLGRFYVRRAKRLLPLLLVVLILTLAAAASWGSGAELSRFGKRALASLAYVANWEQIASGQSYWDGFGVVDPLGHMWSLAITEQFYLLWPLLLLGALTLGRVLHRHARRDSPWQRSRAAAAIVLVLSLAGLVLGFLLPRAVYDGHNADRVYLGTDTHFIGLVAGAAAASVTFLLLQGRARRSATIPAALRSRDARLEIALTIAISTVSFACLAAIVLLSIRATTYEASWLYEYGFAAVAVLSGILVLTLTSSQNVLCRVFALKPLVELGKVSYTLFLIHLPVYWVIVTVCAWKAPEDVLILGVPFSILLASGMHHLIAEPVRLRTWRTKGRTIFFSMLALTAIAVTIIPPAFASMPKGAGGIRVLTLGDSLANDFASTLTANAADRFTVIDKGLPGCGIAGSSGQLTAAGISHSSPQGCDPWEERWRSALSTSNPDAVVVDIAWDAVTQVFGERHVDLLDPEYADEYRQQLTKMVDLLDSAPGTAFIANSRRHSAVVTADQARAFNALLDAVVADRPGVVVLDLQSAVCDAQECALRTDGGRPLYLDDRVHFSDAGKQQIAPWLMQEIVRRVEVTPPDGATGSHR
ncbi:acyltransferase family protein [Microbacterium testaceum]|uniref:acyltransferase family protein n=1 Tax=Microbacterium testaceum TaxID=2033 RepID=UPI002AC45CF2|nr:acyltransferase family protein [Microbacterium testaceum]MDZ5145662.1 acyltransferase [Microbacterium testaceum]